MTFEQFANVTRKIAGAAAEDGEDFLPTFSNPAERNVRVLENAPMGDAIQAVTRDWAVEQGSAAYFIAYAWRERVRVEQYEHGAMLQSAEIDVVSGT